MWMHPFCVLTCKRRHLLLRLPLCSQVSQNFPSSDITTTQSLCQVSCFISCHSLISIGYFLFFFYKCTAAFTGTIKFHITSPTKLFDGFPTSPSLVGHLSHLCSWGHKTGNGLLQVLKCFHLVYFWRFILISLRLVILRSSGPGRDHKVFSEMTSIWLWKILIPRIMKLK